MTLPYNPSLGQFAVATSTPYTIDAPILFDWFSTVISQYANSPVLLQLIGNFAEYIDPSANLNQFFRLVFDVDTAQGYGLDVWGRIVGVTRVLHLPVPGKYLGFIEAIPDAYSFNEGIFYGGSTLTSNFALSDTAFRKLILAKALANISDGSIPSINQILINLFSSYGDCYVIDNGDMTMKYSFGGSLNPVDYAIVVQSGVLPKPTGVSFTVEQRP